MTQNGNTKRTNEQVIPLNPQKAPTPTSDFHPNRVPIKGRKSAVTRQVRAQCYKQNYPF